MKQYFIHTAKRQPDKSAGAKIVSPDCWLASQSSSLNKLAEQSRTARMYLAEVAGTLFVTTDRDYRVERNDRVRDMTTSRLGYDERYE